MATDLEDIYDVLEEMSERIEQLNDTLKKIADEMYLIRIGEKE